MDEKRVVAKLKKKKIKKKIQKVSFEKTYLVKVLATTFTIATKIHMGEETA